MINCRGRKLAHIWSPKTLKRRRETDTRGTRGSWFSVSGLPRVEVVLDKLESTWGLSPSFHSEISAWKHRLLTPIREWPHQRKFSSTVRLAVERLKFSFPKLLSVPVWCGKNPGSPGVPGGVGHRWRLSLAGELTREGWLWWGQDGAVAKGYRMNCQGPDLTGVTASPGAHSTRRARGAKLGKKEAGLS